MIEFAAIAGDVVIILASAVIAELLKFGDLALEPNYVFPVCLGAILSVNILRWRQLYALETYAKRAQQTVMIVGVQAATTGKMPADCDAAPAKFSAPDLGIPGVGAGLADLKAAFGAASGSKIAYRADEPGADALGTALNAQYIGYVLSSGKVTGYGAGETSVPAKPQN